MLLGGCETAVDPVVGTDRAFSLYGVLQPRADTQWVRVYPIETRLTPTTPAPLEATLAATDLTSGAQTAWRDSVIQEPDGRYAHVYWRPLRVAYGHLYRLDAQNAAGQTTHVTVEVPVNAALVIQPPDIRANGVIVPMLVNNDVPRLLRVEVEYHFQYDFRQNVSGPGLPTERATRSYDAQAHRTDGGWVIPINLQGDFLTLQAIFDDNNLWNPRYGFVLLDMTLRLAVVNAEWDPPEGMFDAEVLIEPGTMSNVEGGFGFVGAGYRLEETWTPDLETLTAAGWTDPTDL